MKNYTILMNRHEVVNGNFETLTDARSRINTLKKIFKHSKFEILINL